jgi:hypothetical protein
MVACFSFLCISFMDKFKFWQIQSSKIIHLFFKSTHGVSYIEKIVEDPCVLFKIILLFYDASYLNCNFHFFFLFLFKKKTCIPLFRNILCKEWVKPN